LAAWRARAASIVARPAMRAMARRRTQSTNPSRSGSLFASSETASNVVRVVT
jgi:hypothetical protein